MPDYFNDSPIETPDDDRYGITPFAHSLAKSILNIQKPVGTTIALNGPWGSGKSSVVNLIRGELKKAGDEALVLTDFKCWWYRGEEALMLAFFQNLNAVLRDKLGHKVKDLVPKLGQGLLQAGPVIGPAVALAATGPIGALVSGSASFAKNFFPEGETLEQTFRKLSKILEKENRRFLVIIDDIDRLSPDEALAIFRLVKSVGHLPNVMYLLVYDRALADRAVAERYPSEGPHFLEKIIQAGFELPTPLQTDLNAAVLASIEKICGKPDESQMRRLMNIFFDVVVPYITTPRHVARFQNAISVTWPAIAYNVDLADFIALETLRLYEPKLFQSIRSNKAKLCGLRQQGDLDQRSESRFEAFISELDEQHLDTSKLALQRLFPRLESVGYSGDFISGWDAERRVCVEKHFDTYFRLSLGEETLSVNKITELIARADDRDFIQSTMREAVGTIRKDGSSFVPVYLDELITHAPKIDKHRVEPLISALFEIHDEIDLEEDKGRGFNMIANTTLRFHWLIRRLTADRFSIQERTDLYLAATRVAALGWLIDFVSSAKNDYRERENGSIREEDCLTTEYAIPSLVDRALHSIRTAASDNSLIYHKDLVNILYRWRDLTGTDATEVRCWTDSLMQNEEALVLLASKLTGESWSYGIGMFSLGDRVSTRTVRAQIDENIDILDAQLFRAGLERLRSDNKLEVASLAIVTTFLDAWDCRINGQDY